MGWFARWRRARAAQRNPVGAEEWAAVVRRFSFLRLLDGAEQARLRELVAAFLAEKSLHGAGGLTISRDIELVIAAQACLLLLGLDLGYYDDWVEIIVYPDEFVVDHEVTDENGIVHRVRGPLSGEAWERGPVILSWRDAQASDGGDGYNVVMHEFAHKLDIRNGTADGFPPLHAGMDRSRWTRSFTEAFDDMQARLDRHEYTLIDPYAAEDPAEFFAVLSELFFEQPGTLQDIYPDVYTQLATFYRQDPLARLHRAAG
jgi:Mlc titration factor MtfA (ptsG expression regulator)